jgi:hypothetical protein
VNLTLPDLETTNFELYENVHPGPADGAVLDDIEGGREIPVDPLADAMAAGAVADITEVPADLLKPRVVWKSMTDEEVALRARGLRQKISSLELEHIHFTIDEHADPDAQVEGVAQQLLQIEDEELPSLRALLAKTETEIVRRTRRHEKEREAAAKVEKRRTLIENTRRRQEHMEEQVERVMGENAAEAAERADHLQEAREHNHPLPRRPAQFTWRWIRRIMKFHDPPLALRVGHAERR